VRRWEMIPDASGRMHLVDMYAYQPDPMEPFFAADKDTKYYLYTRGHDRVEIKMDVDSIDASDFNRNHPTRMMIHGWNGDETSSVNSQVIREYLNHGDFNCIMVDWSKGAGTLDYITASYRIDDVAKVTATFVDFLIQHDFVRAETLHIIGHSLGAHGAGVIGKNVQNGRIRAIFALDPAGPLYFTDSPQWRVDASDGDYVEVLHSNGGTLGFGWPLGHADIYLNFGRSQPGCGLDITGSCAHSRAPQIFAESINDPGFVTIPCTSFEEIWDKKKCTDQSPDQTISMIPEPANIDRRGFFLVQTSSSSPFAQF